MFSAAPRRSAPLSMLRSRSTGLTTLLDLWRSRRALAELDATRLDDIACRQMPRNARLPARCGMCPSPGAAEK